MENQSILSLSVTEEQKLAIQAFFNHNDWDFNEIPQTNNNNNDNSNNEDNEETDTVDAEENEVETRSEDTIDVNDQNDDVCQECFCLPCVTTNRQAWLGNGQMAHNRNSGIRKQKYKLFWRMLQDRGAWSNPRYLRKKSRLLNRDRVDDSVVVVRREVMPDCILNLVRDLYPNPKSKPYMGHKWY